MALIKKYENRRLYNTAASRYVNLDDIAVMVRSGEDVRVVDAKTDADLTREILLQVLLAAPGGADLLPVGMLRRVIRCTGDDPLNRLLRQHLTVALDMLHAQMDAAEGQLSRLVPGTRRESTGRASKVPETPPARSDAPTHRGSEPDGPSVPADDMAALRTRLEALEARLRPAR